MQSKPWKPTKAWWNAYANLHGSDEIKPVKKRAKPQQLERREQMKFNAWFDEFLWVKGYRWFHPANGGSRRSSIEGANFKRMGVKSGVPDVILPMARKSYHGLVIEFKRVDGKISNVDEMQVEWLDWFEGQQWSVHVAFGFDQAKDIVKDYFTSSICYDQFSQRETTWQILRKR